MAINPDAQMFDKPVRAEVTFESFRVNKRKEVWLKVVAPKLEAWNLVPTMGWDEHVQLYVFIKRPTEKPKEVGVFMWNGDTQTGPCEHRISLWSRMEQLKKVNPPFDFNTLEEGATFEIVLALPHQVKLPIQALEKSSAKKVKTDADEQPDTLVAG